MQKIKRISVLLLSVILILVCSFSTFASVRDLMIQTDSNAHRTMSIYNTYGIMPYSSIGTVENTVSGSGSSVYVSIRYVTSDGETKYKYPALEKVNNRFKFSVTDLPVGAYINRVSITMSRGSLPPVGNYLMSFDFASDFACEYNNAPRLYAFKETDNATETEFLEDISYEQSSGDIYIAPMAVKINNVSRMGFHFYRKTTDTSIHDFGGSFAIRFVPTDESSDSVVIGGSSDSNIDYQNGVSSSLSDLSSSVGEMTDEISGVTEAIQNLQGAMEPHYNNVLTQLHHITEQLHAFYDQIYNNIHLKEYALWQNIKTAIENIDLEVNVNLDKLKTSIDNMSQAIQNKLQSVTDTITGGYDNSGIEQNGSELDSSISEYEEAEQNVLESVNESLNDFEFDADMSEYTNIVQVISDFLQELYDSSGGFKLVINLSLMLSVASIVIGVYRFKEGG